MMTCFRVYTEDMNRALIVKEASKRFCNGFTLIKGQGCWQGTSEKCLIIEIIRQREVDHTVRRFAADIKRLNNQDAVYVTATELTIAELV